MRIMFFENDVEEFMEINASPCWNPKEGETEDNPGHFFVTLCRYGWWECKDPDDKQTIFEVNGEYILDGTVETYQAAVANYKKITKQLLTKGYCKADDFENFDWF